MTLAGLGVPQQVVYSVKRLARSEILQQVVYDDTGWFRGTTASSL